MMHNINKPTCTIHPHLLYRLALKLKRKATSLLDLVIQIWFWYSVHRRSKNEE